MLTIPPRPRTPRAPLRAIAALVLLALVATACASGGATGTTPLAKVPEAVVDAVDGGSEPGTTLPPVVAEESVVVAALVPDFTALEGTGYVPDLSPEHYADRWRAEAARLSDEGVVPGLPIEIEPVTWDPLSPETIQAACELITNDLRPFFVVNSGGYPEAGLSCIARGGIPVFAAGPVANVRIERSEDRLFTVEPTREAMAEATAQRLHESDHLLDPVAVIANDQPGDREGGRKLADSLAAIGYNVLIEELPTSRGLLEVRPRVGPVLDMLRSEGVNTVIFASNGSIALEFGDRLFGQRWTVLGTDLDGLMTALTARRLPEGWLGVQGVADSVPTTVAESPYEGRCRNTFDRFLDNRYSVAPVADWSFSAGRSPRTNRGVPDDSITPPGDVGYVECTIMRTAAIALRTLSAQPDQTEFIAALQEVEQAPVALDLAGGFGTRRWLTDGIIDVELAAADDPRCEVAGQQCWAAVGGDRSTLGPPQPLAQGALGTPDETNAEQQGGVLDDN